MYKKLIYLACFVWVMAALPAVTHAQVENLVSNPSFEDGFEPAWWTWGWEAGLASTYEIDPSMAIDGANSIRVDPVGGGENWYFMIINSPIALEVGTTYTYSFWAKAEEPRTIGAKLKAVDNSVDWAVTSFDVTTDWAEYTFTAEAMNGSAKFELHCGNAVSVWFDFIYVYEGEYMAGIMPGSAPRVQAANPAPADGAMHPATWVSLEWRPGVQAASHDVYFGDNPDDVESGAEGTFVGNQAAPNALAGFPGFPYPEGLVPGTTYYWRVDEVNDADPNSPWTGEIWSFSIPSKTAYAPLPADGADSVELDSRLNWTPGFEAQLHTVYIGDDYDTVSNATGNAVQPLATFSPTLEEEKVYYWRVDEFDGIATHKGEIWSFATPGAVADPQPANDAVDVEMNATLSWTPADSAASSDLYFGADADAVYNATAASPEYVGNKAPGSETYDPGKLDLAATYHWRVDAVYADETVKGLLWSFTVADFISVDDFESYNDADPPDPNSNRIFDKWIDGFGTTDNGALVGNDLPPYAEQRIVHGGNQAMVYSYDNNLKTSEATLTLVHPRDWTEAGVTKLSLWFRGDSTNAAEPMFVALNDTAVVYHDDATATQSRIWTEWVVDLSAFGVDLANVDSITIGFGTRGNPAAGGAGTMRFDDIRLVR
jgi:hypothetical protein